MVNVIYGLRCPISGDIRYIGKSDDAGRRYKAHLRFVRTPKSHKERWIAKLSTNGLVPSLCILRVIRDGEDWSEIERQEIAKAKNLGWPLTNMTKGGEGSELTPEARASKNATMASPITRKKLSESAKRKWRDPEMAARCIAANKTTEKRAKLSQSAIARATPEYRAMMASRSKAAWDDTGKRAKIEAGITQEVKTKVSEASKNMWSNKQFSAKALATLHSETTKKKLREIRNTPEYKEAQRRTRSTSEFKQKASIAQKLAWERRKLATEENENIRTANNPRKSGTANARVSEQRGLV